MEYLLIEFPPHSRINTDLRKKFIRQTAQAGVSPSDFFRRLIKMTDEDDTKRTPELQEGERDFLEMEIRIVKCLQMMSQKQTWKDAPYATLGRYDRFNFFPISRRT